MLTVKSLWVKMLEASVHVFFFKSALVLFIVINGKKRPKHYTKMFPHPASKIAC